jgi:hypothetical protein
VEWLKAAYAIAEEEVGRAGGFRSGSCTARPLLKQKSRHRPTAVPETLLHLPRRQRRGRRRLRGSCRRPTVSRDPLPGLPLAYKPSRAPARHRLMLNTSPPSNPRHRGGAAALARGRALPALPAGDDAGAREPGGGVPEGGGGALGRPGRPGVALVAACALRGSVLRPPDPVLARPPAPPVPQVVRMAMEMEPLLLAPAERALPDATHPEARWAGRWRRGSRCTQLAAFGPWHRAPQAEPRRRPLPPALHRLAGAAAAQRRARLGHARAAAARARALGRGAGGGLQRVGCAAGGEGGLAAAGGVAGARARGRAGWHGFWRLNGAVQIVNAAARPRGTQAARSLTRPRCRPSAPPPLCRQPHSQSARELRRMVLESLDALFGMGIPLPAEAVAMHLEAMEGVFSRWGSGAGLGLMECAPLRFQRCRAPGGRARREPAQRSLFIPPRHRRCLAHSLHPAPPPQTPPPAPPPPPPPPPTPPPPSSPPPVPRAHPRPPAAT